MSISSLSSKVQFNNRELSNLILLSAASCISLFGTSIYNFAIGLYVLKLTGSGLSFATTLVIGILSTVLVNPIAGVAADRFNKKAIVIAMDILCALVLIVIFLISMIHTLNLSIIYVSTLFINMFSSFYSISLEASKPNLVTEEKLVSINSLSKVIEAASSIIGPMIGGIIFAFIDIRLFIIIDGVSFLLSAFSELFIDFSFNHKKVIDNNIKINFVDDIKESIRYIRTKKTIINMFSVFVVLNFFIGLAINIPVPYIINHVIKLDAKLFGIIEASFPIGMILGAIMIKRIMDRYSYEKLLKSSSVLLSTCMIAIGISVIIHVKIHNQIILLVYFFLIMALSGVAISFIDIPIFYLLQKTIPDTIRGRVLSIGTSFAKIVLPAALIISGALINQLPAYILPILSGVCLCIFSLYFIKIYG